MDEITRQEICGDIEEDITERPEEEEEEKEAKVISFVENDILFFRVETTVSKGLVTKKVKQSLQKTNKRLETVIKFELKENNYLISICGQNKSKVIESQMTLSRLLVLSRRKRPFTHLITVPFNFDPLRQQFVAFKSQVLDQFSDGHGIDENLFQQPHKLHMTFCVLTLLNQKEVVLAKDILNKSLDQIVRPMIGDKPLKVSVEGLDVIKGNAKRCHVLYARINDESNRLQTIADRILGLYIKSGLLEDTNDTKVKLHITFLNSLFRQRFLHKDKSREKESNKRIKRESFDAKDIIDCYKSHKFCESFVRSIQLNDIKTKSDDGFYGSVQTIQLSEEETSFD